MRTRHGSVRPFALLSGGGTAGHVQPALAVGEALVARGHERSSIDYVGSRRGMEGRLVPEAGFQVTLLPGRGIQRRLALENLGAAAGLAAACVLAVAMLIRRRPRVVVTVGGYAGLPCALAAILLRVPLVVVSYDAVPGTANRIVARFARKCAVAFEASSLPNQVVTGAPLRSSVLEADRSPQGRVAARAAIGVPEDRFLLAVAGGSLGARRLNDATVGLARSWASRDDLAIYHVTGERNLALIEAEAASVGLGRKDPSGAAGVNASGTGPGTATQTGLEYRVVGYEKKMPALLAACDLAVCRAGASTVAELAAIGTPSVLVPLPGAPHDHQTRNAEALTRLGAAVLLKDGDCTAERLSELVASLVGQPSRLAAMGAAAVAAGHRDAADRVAALVESVAEGVA
ncbi:MAG: UDP-N-acetylglucosamine--N-acetylmuramyl-(pentapeptide) pyrophosphoryl-undecaprenol N-acetylglucosamine transferase [Acidimicrobiales bacterium]|jgi:UDP-N-acetylglucosamine--N-acetylmuramyl-(pentapeptide) pyrophosphoryl-undecaprenol N-acetylglucosamine transferase